MTDDCPLTLSLCAGIVIAAWTLIVTQIELWSLLHGAQIAALMGFGTWAMIEAMKIVNVAWELWKADQKCRRSSG